MRIFFLVILFACIGVPWNAKAFPDSRFKKVSDLIFGSTRVVLLPFGNAEPAGVIRFAWFNIALSLSSFAFPFAFGVGDPDLDLCND